jgi:hypothetical protein
LLIEILVTAAESILLIYYTKFGGGIFKLAILSLSSGSIFTVFSNFVKIRYCPRFVCLSVPLLLSMGLTDLARLWLNRPQGMNQGRNFFRPILAPTGWVRSPNSVYFHIKIGFY